MIDNEEITILGECNFRNKKVKFGIKTDDRRRHVYIVGKTGTGKTTLEENMMIDDIRAGHGMALIDPHGDFSKKIINFIPEERIDDVIYFNPGDIDYPIAFNPLEKVTDEHRHLIASGIMAVFEKIWPDVWSARMQYILNNTLLALLEFPNATLLGIMRMLSDKGYRKQVVNNLTDPVVKSFWINEFGQYEQRFAVEAVAAIQNKVGQFIANPLIRNVIGQPHSLINLRKVMDEGKILIANVSKGEIGEDNSALLGAMLITRIQLAAMSRVDIPEEERRDFYLYIDEFQNFSTESFVNIFSEARKYRLSIVIAHQYIAQLIGEDTKVRDAIFGNVGTFVIFRVGANDAEFLEPEFTPKFTQEDLVNLTKYNIYVKLMIDGVASKPFSALTLPPHTVPERSFADVIIENTRNKYSVPRESVEKRIQIEWGGGEEVAIEKIERKGEKGLEVLEKEPPKRERRKHEIDKEKLHEALGFVGSEMDVRDKAINPEKFTNLNNEFLAFLKSRGVGDASNTELTFLTTEKILKKLEETNDTSKVDQIALGSFIGETLNKLFNGKWEWSDSKNGWAVVLRSKDGDRVENDVFEKAESRLKNGSDDSLKEYYGHVRALVEGGFEAMLNESSIKNSSEQDGS
jgi:hypothetical protein